MVVNTGGVGPSTRTSSRWFLLLITAMSKAAMMGCTSPQPGLTVFLNPRPLTILLALLFVCPIILSVFLLAFHCDIVSIVVTTNEHSIASGRNCPSSTNLDQKVLEGKTPPAGSQH
jgi:hypothetical protein